MNKIIKLALTLLLIIGIISPANAEILLKSLNSPVSLVIQNNLAVDKTMVGDPFILLIPDNIVYKTQNLKIKTEFKGEITKINKTKRFNRNGYFRLHFKQMCQSETDCIDLDTTFKKPLFVNVYQIEIQKDQNNSNMFFDIGKFAVIETVSLFIKYLDVAVDESTAIYTEFHNDPTHQKPFIKKVANGAWEGTGIPEKVRFAYKFVKVGADPAYISGQSMEIKFKKKIMQKFFDLSNKKASI